MKPETQVFGGVAEGQDQPHAHYWGHKGWYHAWFGRGNWNWFFGQRSTNNG
jgi:hypothetical protein